MAKKRIFFIINLAYLLSIFIFYRVQCCVPQYADCPVGQFCQTGGVCRNCGDVYKYCVACSGGYQIDVFCDQCSNGYSAARQKGCFCGGGPLCSNGQLCLDKYCQNCQQAIPYCLQCQTQNGSLSTTQCFQCGYGTLLNDNQCLCNASKLCSNEQACLNGQCQNCDILIKNCQQCYSTNGNHFGLFCNVCKYGLSFQNNSCLCNGENCNQFSACISNKCLFCSQKIFLCASCVANERGSDIQCTSCLDGYFVQSNSCRCGGGTCSQGQICLQNQCISCYQKTKYCSNCTTDDGLWMTCLNCSKGLSLHQGQCLCAQQDCFEEGQICFKSQCKKCQDVINQCTQCYTVNGSQAVCLQCGNGYVLQKNQCFCANATCSPSQVCLQKECTSCSVSIPYCQECTTESGIDLICTKCNNRFQLNQNKCLCGRFQCKSGNFCTRKTLCYPVCLHCGSFIQNCAECNNNQLYSEKDDDMNNYVEQMQNYLQDISIHANLKSLIECTLCNRGFKLRDNQCVA